MFYAKCRSGRSICGLQRALASTSVSLLSISGANMKATMTPCEAIEQACGPLLRLLDVLIMLLFMSLVIS